MRLATFVWRRPVFVHHALAPARLAALLPPGLTLDRRDGSAWLSLVALVVDGPAPRALLEVAGPLFRYRQINLRTYVVGDAGPGIFLLDTLVDRRFAALARLGGLPYRRVRGLDVRRDGDRVAVASPVATVEARLGGPPVAPAVGSLSWFLAERYVVYGARAGTTWAARVAHTPWRLAPLVELEELPRHPLLEGAVPTLGQLGDDHVVELVEARAVDYFARQRPDWSGAHQPMPPNGPPPLQQA